MGVCMSGCVQVSLRMSGGLRVVGVSFRGYAREYKDNTYCDYCIYDVFTSILALIKGKGS